MRNLIIYSIICLLAASCASKAPVQSNNQQGPSSLNPGQNQGRNYASGAKQKKSFWNLFRKKESAWGDQLVDEYEQRMKDNAKEAKRKEKEMQKPQYADFTYFGHKRKPKKRPPHKMKFCKVCGIKH